MALLQEYIASEIIKNIDDINIYDKVTNLYPSLKKLSTNSHIKSSVLYNCLTNKLRYLLNRSFFIRINRSNNFISALALLEDYKILIDSRKVFIKYICDCLINKMECLYTCPTVYWKIILKMFHKVQYMFYIPCMDLTANNLNNNITVNENHIVRKGDNINNFYFNFSECITHDIFLLFISHEINGKWDIAYTKIFLEDLSIEKIHEIIEERKKDDELQGVINYKKIFIPFSSEKFKNKLSEILLDEMKNQFDNVLISCN